MTKHRPGAGLVLAVIAIVLALGGTATAAKLITGKQVKNSSLTGADIKNSSLAGGDVKNGSIGPNDLSSAAKKAAAGAAGSAGPKGDTGAAGAPGAKGDAGAAGTNGTNGTNGDDAGSSWMGRMDSLSAVDATIQFGFVNGSASANSVENDRALITPNVPTRAASLTVRLNTAPGAGDSRTFRLEINGNSTSLACVISGANTSCTSPGSVAIAAGSLVTFRGAAIGTPTAADALYSMSTSEQ